MSHSVPSELRAWAHREDHGRCAYCQTPEELSAVSFETDHITPIRAGGIAESANLCLCCPTCNRHKGARQYVQDPQTETIVPLYHPRSNAWSDHFAWSSSKLHIVGKTSIGRATVEALHVNRPQLVRLRQLWARLGYAPWAGT